MHLQWLSQVETDGGRVWKERHLDWMDRTQWRKHTEDRRAGCPSTSPPTNRKHCVCCTKAITRGEETDIGSEMMELWWRRLSDMRSLLSPATLWCWETSAPGTHVASPTASYPPVWSWCQRHSVHTPGYTSCGVKPNVASQRISRLSITPTQEGTSFETHSIKMSDENEKVSRPVTSRKKWVFGFEGYVEGKCK